ncbi:hypothetical protein [Clostridium folliculivorans]|uniref:hypothetical protein n=1 Tax=Clostridium folliculivorans TaxID=2886038 RepID=UPI0021C321C5|nr:hypothetical protein [Clostridium folliculivorans]GKU30196.1 hypothetical protein CFB3_23030 [Clostridium folliculivorans]
MKKRILYSICFSLILVLSILVSRSDKVDAVAKTTTITGIYFSVPLCGECIEDKKVLNEISSNSSILKLKYKFNFKEYSLNEDQNLKLLQQYYEYYKVPKDEQSVPILFVADKYYKDKDEIKNLLPKLLLDENVKETPVLGKSDSINYFSVKDTLSIFVVGLLNGLNPCSISMLLFFLTIINSKNAGIKRMGFAFVVGKFITYLLLGSLLYSSISKLNVGYYKVGLKIVFILFSSLLIYLNMKDFLSIKKNDYKHIKNQLPKKVRSYNHKLINNLLEGKNSYILILLCFIVGIAVSIGEFMCTGQIYVATLAYMVRSSTQFSLIAFFQLIIYSSAFCIPPLIITLLIDRGTSIFDVSDIMRSKLHYIKLANSIVIAILCIAAVIFF